MYQIEQQYSSSSSSSSSNEQQNKTDCSEQNELNDEIVFIIEEKIYQKKGCCVNFNDINLPISDGMSTYSYEIQESLYNYLKQMDEKERKTYCIAISHLGSSFNLLKSNGYLKWKK